MAELRELLNEEIKNQIEELASLEPGGTEREKAVNNMVKLYNLQMEEAKLAADAEEKRRQAEIDERVRQEEQRERTKDRWLRYGGELATVLLTLLFWGKQFRDGYRFEENGTYISDTFKGARNLASKVIGFKKR